MYYSHEKQLLPLREKRLSLPKEDEELMPEHSNKSNVLYLPGGTEKIGTEKVNGLIKSFVGGIDEECGEDIANGENQPPVSEDDSKVVHDGISYIDVIDGNNAKKEIDEESHTTITKKEKTQFVEKERRTLNNLNILIPIATVLILLFFFILYKCSCCGFEICKKKKNIIDTDSFRVLLLTGEKGTIACKVWGQKLGATIPRRSNEGTEEWFQASRRSVLRMRNLTAVRGLPGSNMLGPMDYFGNLGNLDKSLFTINANYDPPLIHQYHISEEQANNHKNTMGSLDPSPFITTINVNWVSGTDSDINQKQKEYDITTSNLKQSLFDGPGLLEVHQKVIKLQSEFDPVNINLSSFKAQLVENDIPIRISKEKLHSKDDFRLVTYEYQPGYSQWQTEHGSGHFLEKHKFSQIIMPMTEDSHGFVVLARKNSVTDELELALDLIGIEIPFGYTLIIEDGCIHGDTSLSGFFMMGMTADHTTMGTADTVFLKSSETKTNVEITMMEKKNHPFNMPYRYPVLFENRTEEEEKKFRDATNSKDFNFIYNPNSKEWSKNGINPIGHTLSNKSLFNKSLPNKSLSKKFND